MIRNFDKKETLRTNKNRVFLKERSKNRNEFLGLFRKSKTADKNLDWKDVSKLIDKKMSDHIKHSDIEWEKRKPETTKDSIKFKTITGASITFYADGSIVVSSPDLDSKNFKYTVDDGDLSGVGKALDSLKNIDRQQGKINASNNRKRESLEKSKRFYSRFAKNINESLIYDLDDEVVQWAKDHIEDRLTDMEDMDIDLDDLAFELTDRENIDGSVFYNTAKSWEWIAEHRLDAGEVFEKVKDELGSCPNPLLDPEAFCVVWLIELVREILAESETVNNGGVVTLTQEVIDNILSEIA